MALKKLIELPNGQRGEFIKIAVQMIDWEQRDCSVRFNLHTSEAHQRARTKPVGMIGRLHLSGAKFEEYLGEAALATVPKSERDPVRYQLYRAAQLEPKCFAPGEGFSSRDLATLAGGERTASTGAIK